MIYKKLKYYFDNGKFRAFISIADNRCWLLLVNDQHTKLTRFKNSERNEVL